MKTCWADFIGKHCWLKWQHGLAENTTTCQQVWIHSNQVSITKTLANKRVCRPFKCITVGSHISKEDASQANIAWNDKGTGCRKFIWSKHKMALMQQQTWSSGVFWLTAVVQSEYPHFKSKVSARGTTVYLLYPPITKSVVFLGWQLPISFQFKCFKSQMSDVAKPIVTKAEKTRICKGNACERCSWLTKLMLKLPILFWMFKIQLSLGN